MQDVFLKNAKKNKKSRLNGRQEGLKREKRAKIDDFCKQMFDFGGVKCTMKFT